jgi:hypothetical protein
LIQVKWGKEGRFEQCNDCGGVSHGTPDVYFKGAYWDENISSEEHPGPKFITSRRDKAMWLKKCNLRESGDRVHGMTRFDPISHRHAMKSLEKR